MHFSVCLPYRGNGNRNRATYFTQVIASVSVLSSLNDSSVFHRPHIFEGWLDSTSEQLKLMERSFFIFSYGAMQVKSLICPQYQMELDPDSPTTPEGMLQSGNGCCSDWSEM